MEPLDPRPAAERAARKQLAQDLRELGKQCEHLARRVTSVAVPTSREELARDMLALNLQVAVIRASAAQTLDLPAVPSSERH